MVEQITIEELRRLFPGATASTIARNLKGLNVAATKPGVSGLCPSKPGPPKPHKRLRQDSKPLLNKLETRFRDEFLAHRDYPVIWEQALRFRLANGLWYKPDFITVEWQEITAWEVKGPHAFRGGFENLKMAATSYRRISWYLAWVDEGWQVQKILP